MLKCEVSNDFGKVEMQGTVLELYADLGSIVRAVYNNLRSGPVPEQAELLRHLLAVSATDPNSKMLVDSEATHISSATPIRKQED